MRYLLDTNIFSRLMKADSVVWSHAKKTAMGEMCISVVSYSEIRFGLAKVPTAIKQRAALQTLLKSIPVIPWDMETADSYGIFKAHMQQTGKNLAPLDLMIAAHAYHLGAVLITNDQAFFKVEGLQVSDWTK